MKAVPEWRGVDASLFHAEIEPLNRPAVLRGLVVTGLPSSARAHRRMPLPITYIVIATTSRFPPSWRSPKFRAAFSTLTICWD